MRLGLRACARTREAPRYSRSYPDGSLRLMPDFTRCVNPVDVDWVFLFVCFFGVFSFLFLVGFVLGGFFLLLVFVLGVLFLFLRGPMLCQFLLPPSLYFRFPLVSTL